jgi:DNA-binding transcriptional regulator YhcF (GntR family)
MTTGTETPLASTTNIIADALRERILSGYYLGRWTPGEKLPSARVIADLEAVDRKTVGAAYRRLALEGLVRIRPRSGVYLAERRSTRPPRPLERLYRRWLTNFYEGARSLELDTRAILHLVTTIAEMEGRSIPVVDSDPASATLLAAELRARLHVPATPLPLEGLRADAFDGAPVVVATPGPAAVLARSLAVPVVAATLDGEFVRGLRKAMEGGGVVVFVPGQEAARRLRRAQDFGQLANGTPPARVEIWLDKATAAAALHDAGSTFVWPGAPGWLRGAVSHLPCVAPEWCLAQAALLRVRAAILDAAIHRAVESASEEGKAAQ